MTTEVKNEIVQSAQPMIQWFQQKGADFAVDLVTAVIILAVGAIAIKLLAKLLTKTLENRLNHKELLVKFCVSVVIKVAWIFLIVTVLGRLGVEVGPIVAGLGVTGFVLGFAFQESLGSFAAGLMIALNEPFKVGDFVSVAGHEGVIKHLDMMAVTLATGDNRRITIPNKQAWGSPIVNYSALEFRRVDFSFGIGYDADIGKARRVMIEAVSAVPGVITGSAQVADPMAEVTAFEDSELAVTCRVWVKNADYWSVFFAGNQKVKEALDQAGLDVPFPQLDVHMVNG